MRALIVIPAYNEGRRIGDLLKEMQGFREDVLVVDDGSADDTTAVVERQGFRQISHEVNAGLAGIYLDATTYAIEHGYTHILSLDADGQHDPRYIPQFIRALEKVDFVSGTRFHQAEALPPSKIASNLFAILLTNEVLNRVLPDVSCGYRGWSLSIFPDQTRFYEEFLSGSRFGIIYKMLIVSYLSNHKSDFIPIPAIYHPDVPMNTKTNEIIGLINMVLSFRTIPSVQNLQELVMTGRAFRITLDGIEFQGTPDTPDSYIFSTDNALAGQRLKTLNNPYFV